MRLPIVRERRPAVCIVRHNYYPDSHVRRDAEALAEAGYDVSVIALRKEGQPARDSLNGVDIHRLPVEHRRGSVPRYIWEYLSFAILAFFRVTWLHLRKRFRVVEVDNMPDILVFSALVPKLTGTPVILYIFDNMPDLLAYLWKTSHRHPVVRLLATLERVSAAFANRVVVTQEMPRRMVVARGVPAEKVTVVVNSADETIFNRDGIAERPSLDDGFQIVTHGAILERYGGATLIDAMPKVLATIPNAHVQIFGAGEFRAELERRVERAGLGDHVHFRGFAPQDELLHTLANADAGYVGMLNDLVLPNKLMEYVTLEVPVVLSRWPTFLYYFPEDAATYFHAGNPDDLARALIGIANNPEVARERARAAKQRYQQYRWPVQKQVYLQVYSDLLAAQSRTREAGLPSVDRSEIA
jgi:glycosyltransferase involved in cell wall biosynthesis